MFVVHGGDFTVPFEYSRDTKLYRRKNNKTKSNNEGSTWGSFHKKVTNFAFNKAA